MEILISLIWAIVAVFGIAIACCIIAPMLFAYFMAKELDK